MIKYSVWYNGGGNQGKPEWCCLPFYSINAVYKELHYWVNGNMDQQNAHLYYEVKEYIK